MRMSVKGILWLRQLLCRHCIFDDVAVFGQCVGFNPNLL